MNYSETLDYLYNTLPMFSRMGSAAYKKDLANIRILCERLGNPQSKFKSIHVGGTNGKGSVSHMLAAILQTAGYKTGLYTSPHLYDFGERIRINGSMIDEDFVVDFVERIKPWINEIEPSFFEITVAMAFDYFAKQKIDIAVIEVGLGGRLDSTNIIKPELSVITNIGWDHTNLLGNTLEEIAFEKSGIIKSGIPVVIGERRKETNEVFEKAATQNKAAAFFAEDFYKSLNHQWKNDHLLLDITRLSENKNYSFEIDLPGIYQLKNLCTVLTATDILIDQGFNISTEIIRKAIKNIKALTGLHGRWEVIHHSPEIILEVAHNREGVQQMLEHLKEINFNQLHIVIGMVKDKDISKVLEILPKEAFYYFTQSKIPRALEAALLKEYAAAHLLNGNDFIDVNEALQDAMLHADKDDLVIVCGSIFLVAEVDRRLVTQFT